MEIRSTRGEITDDLDSGIAQPFVFLEMAADKGPPAEIAKTIRRRVRGELGLPIWVGVAHTKHLAKIASQVAKPDGLVVRQPVETDCIDHRMDGFARSPRLIAAAAGDRGTRSRLSKLVESHGSSRGWYQRSGASAKAVWGRCGCGRRSTAWRIVLRPQHRYQAPAPSAHR
jgi:hypothetical protein